MQMKTTRKWKPRWTKQNKKKNKKNLDPTGEEEGFIRVEWQGFRKKCYQQYKYHTSWRNEMPITTKNKVDAAQEIPSYQVHQELAPKSPRP